MFRDFKNWLENYTQFNIRIYYFYFTRLIYVQIYFALYGTSYKTHVIALFSCRVNWTASHVHKSLRDCMQHTYIHTHTHKIHFQYFKCTYNYVYFIYQDIL